MNNKPQHFATVGGTIC